MKIRLLIASGDDDYAEHLSNYLSSKYKDAFFVSVCSTSQNLNELLAVSEFDAALLEPELIADMNLSLIRLPLMLWDESAPGPYIRQDVATIGKYQRISAIVCSVLEQYAKVSSDELNPGAGGARVTAVWSPAGGTGTTSVAIAYASRLSSCGNKALYLNMEYFSSSPAYFSDDGRSISAVFEMLEKNEGNLKMLIQAIIKQDAATGVYYFRRPENYDDVNILSAEDISSLTTACAGAAEELIIDLPCSCDVRTRQILKLSDRVLIVCDHTGASNVKLRQFISQNSVYEQIKAKAILVGNKGFTYSGPEFDEKITLPIIQSADAATVSKSMSGCVFEGDRK